MSLSLDDCLQVTEVVKIDFNIEGYHYQSSTEDQVQSGQNAYKHLSQLAFN